MSSVTFPGEIWVLNRDAVTTDNIDSADCPEYPNSVHLAPQEQISKEAEMGVVQGPAVVHAHVKVL